MTEDETVGWHHRLNGHEFKQTPGDGEGQGSLVCCSPWGCKGSDTTEPLNSNKLTKAACIFAKLSNNIICSRRIYFFQEIIVEQFQ